MCLFCKIANGEIPSKKVYEDNDFLAFLDISQTTEGHTLIIPKKHFDNFLEADNETLKKLSVLTKQIANKIKENTGCKGINILTNCGEYAGQTINHCHIHIIPRYDYNDLEIKFKSNNPSDEELNKTLNKINKSC